MRRPNIPALVKTDRATERREEKDVFRVSAERCEAEARQELGGLFVGGRRKEMRILLLLCRGRTEGWRNNLDGLCLMEKRERERQTDKKKHSTRFRLRPLGSALLV